MFAGAEMSPESLEKVSGTEDIKSDEVG